MTANTPTGHQVTVYTQPGCGPCRATMRSLDNQGLDYRAIDVTTDPEAKAHLAAQDWSATPVVEVTDPETGDVVAAWSKLRVDALHALGREDTDVATLDHRVGVSEDDTRASASTTGGFSVEGLGE